MITRVLFHSLICSGEERSDAARGSVAMANKRGDIGHPGLVPCCNSKYWESILLVRTDDIGDLYNKFNHDVNFEPNLNLSRH